MQVGPPPPSDAARRRRRRATRDRHGRGLRSALAPRDVPISRAPSDSFDELVLDAVEDLERHWAEELAGVEFAVEDVPDLAAGSSPEFDPDVVSDHGVPLGRLHRTGLPPITKPLVVIYRRPVEARTSDSLDRGDLVFAIVAELAAELLGKDLDELD